ncbi:MAG: FliA/WhiG family RNA polymerase sigma factor [Synergistaceae bacterium]|jgi:RNA polymerase sigma factor for flagellar operon FliA|nr:FliA/WhiG family RNA polymerase sigma factor [Synergistaceae bacterium]
MRSREPRLKDEIIKRFLPLVRYVASRMSVKFQVGIDFEDILSFGILGLLDAVDRFEPERGYVFQTFAVPRIRGAILDELRRYDWISRSGREKLQKFDRTLEEIAKTKGRTDDKSLMAAMGMDEQAYKDLLEIASRSYVVSLDDVLALDDGDMQREDVTDDIQPNALDIIEQNEERSMVVEALKKIPERERTLLSLYYYEGLTLKEIGLVLGVTESRVSQIHGRALSLLKAEIKSLSGV